MHSTHINFPRLLTLVALVYMTGCGEKARPSSTARVPRDAVKTFFEALESGDTEKALSVAQDGSKYRKPLTAFVDCMHAGYQFRQKVINTRGEGAWTEYLDAKPKTALTLKLMRTDAAYLETQQLEQPDSDHAVFFNPEFDVPVDLVRIDEFWYVNLSKVFPVNSSDDVQKTVNFWNGFRAAVLHRTKHVDDRSKTMFEIKEAMGTMFWSN